ncbi:MAG: CBS domain-containing protein [Candidimonas sp.]|nr:MAG: CBS domain-containing protein [Candidimonas sp.]
MRFFKFLPWSAKPVAPKPGDFTTDKRVLYLMALGVPVGALGDLSSWVLFKLIYLCTNIAYYGEFSFAKKAIEGSPFGWYTLFTPIVGGVIVGLMARFGSDKIRGNGIPEVIESILVGESRIGPKIAVWKPLSSGVVIGTGGPFGAEGPVIMTGGALGSLLGQALRMSAAERKTLMVAGAAAGMTAVFNTPIASILIAVELLLFEWKPRSFLPVAVSSIVAAVLRPFIMDEPTPIFPYVGGVTLSVVHMGAWALMGLIAGLCSCLLTIIVYACKDGFRKLPVNWMLWPALGGVVVGIGGLIEPAALGVGYDNIRHLLAGGVVLRVALLLLIVKAVIWSAALGSGTSGGVLAPLLIIGGALGQVLAPWFPHEDPGFWPLIAMVAMMGGTMRAPLTSTLFAVEVTGNFTVLLPVMTACVSACALTVLLLRRSILTERVARRGLNLTREYDVDSFAVTKVSDVMTRAVQTLPAAMTMPEVIAFFAAAEFRHSGYPVVDDGGRVLGVVTRDDALAWSADCAATSGCADPTLRESLRDRELLVGYPDEMAGLVVDRMAVADVHHVPIIARGSGRLLGVVTCEDLLRVWLHRLHEEGDREAYYGWRSARRGAVKAKPGGANDAST